MKKTLLELVQSVLNVMNSDEVNDINDTAEALQVAGLIKDSYFDFVSRDDYKYLQTVRRLDGLSDSNFPNYLRVPNDVMFVMNVAYNKRTLEDTNDKYEDLIFLEDTDFIKMMYQRDSSDSIVDTITTEGLIKLFVYNDRAPTYWTTFDDVNIITDSYDSAIDSTLQASKTSAKVVRTTEFIIDNDFIPDLATHMFPAFESECKRYCLVTLKEIDNPVEAKREFRGMARLRHNKKQIRSPQRGKNFGRR